MAVDYMTFLTTSNSLTSAACLSVKEQYHPSRVYVTATQYCIKLPASDM